MGSPAGGPAPAVTPVQAPDSGNDWTLVSVAAGFVLLAVCTGLATGVRVRVRRRVTA